MQRLQAKNKVLRMPLAHIGAVVSATEIATLEQRIREGTGWQNTGLQDSGYVSREVAFMMGESGQPANGFHTEVSSNTNPATGPSPAIESMAVSVSTSTSRR